MVRMKDNISSKRYETKEQGGCSKRGRPGWEDCLKRDLRKAEEEEKWREKTNNREQWKSNESSHTAVTNARPHPYKRETKGSIRSPYWSVKLSQI